MIRLCIGLMFPPLIYNIKHVHMCIVLMNNRVMYDNENKPCPQVSQLYIKTIIIEHSELQCIH